MSTTQEQMERELEGGDTESAIDVMRRMDAERSTVGEPVAAVAAREKSLRAQYPLQPQDAAPAPAPNMGGEEAGGWTPPPGFLDGLEGIPNYQQEMQETEEVDVTLPSGEEVTVVIPKGMPDDLVVQRLKAAGELPPDPSVEREPVMALLQGASMRTADEAAALMGAVTAKVDSMRPGEQGAEDTAFADVYNDILESERYKLTRYAHEYPKEAAAWELGGALGTAVVSGGSSAPLTTGRLTATGAGWGAGYGAGGADPAPDLSYIESMKQRVSGAAEGAALGAAGGVAIAGVTRGIPKIRQKRKVKKGRISQKGANALQKDYQKIVTIEQMSGRTGAEAHAAARKKLGMNTDDTYRMSLMSDSPLYTATNAQQAADYAVANQLWKSGIASWGFMKPIDRIIRPIIGRIEDHAPYLANQLRIYEGRVYQDVHNWHETVKPYIDSVRHKMSSSERRAIDVMMYNGRVKEAREFLVGRLGQQAGKDFDVMRDTLTKISKEMKQKGAKYRDVEGWFPRRIKDLEGLKERLGTKYLQGFDAYVDRIGNEQAALNAWMRAVPGSRIKETSLRSRKVSEVNEDLVEYYHDHIGSMDLFFREAAQHIRRRELFAGHVKVNPHGVEEVEKSIKSLVNTLTDLTPKARTEIMDLLKVRFTKGEQGMDKAFANVRAIAHNTLLANIYSATTQLGDIGVSAWLNGGWATTKAVIGKNKITPDELGIMRELVQEISDPGSINAWTDRLFRWSGFRAVDRLGKNAAINSAYTNATRMARSYKGRKRLTEELLPKWGRETTELVDDLKNGRMTELVKTYLFTRLSEMQPISRSEVPEMFLQMPNGRLFYQLTTWTIKQLELVRTKLFRQMLHGNAREKAVAAKETMRMIVLVGGANLTSEELKRFMSGKESSMEGLQEDEMMVGIGAKLLAHTFKNFVGDEDPMSGIASAMEVTIPTVDLIGKIGQDGIKYGQKVNEYQDAATDTEEFAEFRREFVDKIPLFGKIYAMWYLGGAEKFNEKAQAERKAEFKKKMSQ